MPLLSTLISSRSNPSACKSFHLITYMAALRFWEFSLLWEWCNLSPGAAPACKYASVCPTEKMLIRFCPIFILSGVIPLVSCYKQGSNGHADKPILICIARVYSQVHGQVWAHHMAPPLSYLMATKHMAARLFSFGYSLVSIGAP